MCKILFSLLVVPIHFSYKIESDLNLTVCVSFVVRSLRKTFDPCTTTHEHSEGLIRTETMKHTFIYIF